MPMHTDIARETARHRDGRFGTQPLDEATVEPLVSPQSVPRVDLDVTRLDDYAWFHITPTENLDSIMSDGVHQGDGRHWKGRPQHALYVTDAAGVFTWMKELRRRGAGAFTSFSVVGIGLDSAVDLDALHVRRQVKVSETAHGIQMRIGVDQLDPEHLEYLGDTSRKPIGWTPPPTPERR